SDRRDGAFCRPGVEESLFNFRFEVSTFWVPQPDPRGLFVTLLPRFWQRCPAYLLIFDFLGLAHLHRAAVTLVVRVLHRHADVHIAAAEMQVVVGPREHGEPVALLDVLPVGAK